MSQLVDEEYCRKSAYEHFWLDQGGRYLSTVLCRSHESSSTARKYIHKCLLRYMMIKWANRLASDDAIFIYREVPDTIAWITHECKYRSRDRNDEVNIVRKLDECLRQGWQEYQQLKFLSSAALQNTSPSFTNPSDKSAEGVESTAALEIRYAYLQLSTLGLRVNYEQMGYDAHDTSVCEAFASTFNHYFDVWCSAFPDLERISFFDLSAQTIDPRVRHFVVNPPFDVVLMNKMIRHIQTLQIQLPFLSFFIVLPDWNEWQEKDEFLYSCLRFERKAKHSHAFLTVDGQSIYACDVVWCWYGLSESMV